MSRSIDAQAISATHKLEREKRLAITLADAAGRETEVTLTSELAAALARVLGEFAAASKPGGAAATKMPSAFAIGAGRYEPVVLVRFEDDAPYGLAPREALRLGRALIAQAQDMAAMPAPLKQ